MILVTIRISVIVVFVVMVVIMVVIIPFFILLLAAGGEGWWCSEYLLTQFLTFAYFLLPLFAFVEEGEPDAHLIEQNHGHSQEGERGNIWGGGDECRNDHNSKNGIRACIAHDLVIEHP